MTRRELIKHAIAHRGTNRAPYCVSFTPEGKARLNAKTGQTSALEFADNDIVEVKPPWWVWEEPSLEMKFLHRERALSIDSGLLMGGQQ